MLTTQQLTHRNGAPPPVGIPPSLLHSSSCFSFRRRIQDPEFKDTHQVTVNFRTLRGVLLRRWMPGMTEEEWLALGEEHEDAQKTVMSIMQRELTLTKRAAAAFLTAADAAGPRLLLGGGEEDDTARKGRGADGGAGGGAGAGGRSGLAVVHEGVAAPGVAAPGSARKKPAAERTPPPRGLEARPQSALGLLSRLLVPLPLIRPLLLTHRSAVLFVSVPPQQSDRHKPVWEVFAQLHKDAASSLALAAEAAAVAEEETAARGTAPVDALPSTGEQTAQGGAGGTLLPPAEVGGGSDEGFSPDSVAAAASFPLDIQPTPPPPPPAAAELAVTAAGEAMAAAGAAMTAAAAAIASSATQQQPPPAAVAAAPQQPPQPTTTTTLLPPEPSLQQHGGTTAIPAGARQRANRTPVAFTLPTRAAAAVCSTIPECEALPLLPRLPHCH